MIRAATYHRVSTVDQDAELARDELRRAVESRGWVLALEVAETGSGARNDRPGLQRVIEAARRRHVDAILVWKLDRFARSALDLLANLREIESAGVRFLAVTQGIDLRPDGDAMSRLMMTVLAGVAEFERSLIRERTRLGVDKARRRGATLGRPRSLSRENTSLAAERRAAGRSWSQVAGELDCSIASARRAVALAEKGIPNESGLLVDAEVVR